MGPVKRCGFVLFSVVAFSAFGQNAAGIHAAVITDASTPHLSAYLEGLAAAPEVELVVLSGLPESSLEMVKATLGEKFAHTYATYDELLAANKPVLAVVTMEARLAPEAIDAVLDAGCHVLAEKPACVNIDDFARLAEKAEKTNRHLMLALANRLNPEVLKARQLVAGGVIGRVFAVDMNLIEDQTRLTKASYHDSWYADRNRSGGGHLAWLGIHWVDLAMYVTDSPISQVTGFTGNVGKQPISIEDAVAMSIRFENGTVGTLTGGYFLDKGFQSMLRIWGTAGWLEIMSDPTRSVRWYTTVGKDPGIQVFERGSEHRVYAAYVGACVRAAAGLDDPPITTHESLRALRVVYGMYDAAATGNTVGVN